MTQYDAHVQNLSIRWTLQIKVILFNNIFSEFSCEKLNYME